LLAIELEQVSRFFDALRKDRRVVALDKVDLQVGEGELFGLLGPNGAGKSTLIKILATLLLPSSGTARVLGHDVAHEPKAVRPRINMVSGGETSGYGMLSVKENIWMFSQFYGIPSKVAKQRMEELIDALDLGYRADSRLRTLSTGERQKMNLVRALITSPDLLFLDEPTLGLDVTSSHLIRDHIRGWVDEGHTLLLTTHYMMEAEDLCDRVAIIDQGRILACDTPSKLKRELGPSSSFAITVSGMRDTSHISSIGGVKGLSVDTMDGRTHLRLAVEDEAVIAEVVSAIVSRKGRIVSLSKSEPSLEDVFLHLVGRGLR
jgi:ABC-2 type transport system ATP-binding protein